MVIRKLRTNHIEQPIGYTLEPLSLSWITESSGKEQAHARVIIALDENFNDIVFDSGEGQLDSICYCPEIQLKPRTRYYWCVEVVADDGDYGSEQSFFETGKMTEDWEADWIKAPFEESPIIVKDFESEPIVSARVYIVGLGVYELYCNGEKVGEEYLAPGYHSYDFWLQSHTYDVTQHICQGKNSLGLMLGDGWYKGRFGFKNSICNVYGDEIIVKAEMHLKYADGSEQIIKTDASWLCHKSPILRSNIYDGEDYDANLEIEDWSKATCDRTNFENAVCADDVKHDNIVDRYSVPIKKHEVFHPEILHTKKGEVVLDYGQNHAGWVEGNVHLEKGQSIKLSYGELLQDDCFYRDNLRKAEAQYTYISDGNKVHFRPHFTYYGYRYVKVEGDIDEKDLKTFVSYALYSDLDEIGVVETSNAQVNQFISNALWGQKSNFVDVPTDCPQRDERMGWTGDTQAFTGTACFNMYAPAFYGKYMEDLMLEQKALDGGVPLVVPFMKRDDETSLLAHHSSCAWGDAATVIPWTTYLFYGDQSMLARQYDSMKDWVLYIKKQDDDNGGLRLWKTGLQLADWLALDNYKEPDSPFGGTDRFYVASAYYAYSASLTAKAAGVLGYKEDQKYFEDLARAVKKAIIDEYFTPNGKIATDTQTAKAIALFMDLVPEENKARVAEDLKKQLEENNSHLETGFVGTTYLCRALSENNGNDMAYTLVLNDDLPSWLYAIKMGATTVWERWNSVLPDGKINPAGMNSMNHYAYGAVVEWMYRNMCGLNPTEESAGFRKAIIKPMPDQRFEYAKCTYDSPIGEYKSSWHIQGDDITYDITIPFGGEAEIIIEGIEPKQLKAGSYSFKSKIL